MGTYTQEDNMSAPKSYEIISSLTSVTTLSQTIYDPATHYPESLTSGGIGDGTGWTAADDFGFNSNKARYVHSSGAGTLTQAVGTLARTGRSGAIYDFTYTVSSPTGATVAMTITTAFASEATSLIGLTVAGTYTVSFTAATTPGAFVLSGTSAATAQTILDDLSLLERVDPITGNRQAVRAVITVGTGAITFTTDGSTPTVISGTHQGHLLNPGDIVTLNDISEIKQFRCINSVASNGAVIKVSYSFL
jgi:hypothetical protein